MLGQREEVRACPAHDGCKRERGGNEHVERAGDERDEPRERAEPCEAVEVPRRVVRERAALPFELVGPCAEFFAPILVRLFWCNCIKEREREGA